MDLELAVEGVVTDGTRQGDNAVDFDLPQTAVPLLATTFCALLGVELSDLDGLPRALPQPKKKSASARMIVKRCIR